MKKCRASSQFAKDHEMNSVYGIVNLPVFQLTGGAGPERRAFGRRLIGVCARRSLSAVLARDGQLGISPRYSVHSLAKQYDLVLVDAELDFPTRQIRIGNQDPSLPDSLAWTGTNDRDMEKFVDRLVEILDRLVHRIPVWACVLIGGKSSRMGRPKHLIADQEKTTWLERTIAVLSPLVDGLVVSGAGNLPEKLGETVRLADIPGVVGPMTGLLAASRWQPVVTWLLVACDMPHISSEALQWLLADRRAGCWGRVPRLAGNKYCEPLFAWYDFRAGQLIEERAYDGDLRIGGIAAHPKIDNPVVPRALHHGWENINTPEQLQATRWTAGD